jgi:hypothetical protein
MINAAEKELLDKLESSYIRDAGYRSRGSRFNSQHYQIFRDVVGLERGPLNLVNTTQELFERNISGSSQKK